MRPWQAPNHHPTHRCQRALLIRFESQLRHQRLVGQIVRVRRVRLREAPRLVCDAKIVEYYKKYVHCTGRRGRWRRSRRARWRRWLRWWRTFVAAHGGTLARFFQSPHSVAPPPAIVYVLAILLSMLRPRSPSIGVACRIFRACFLAQRGT